MKVYCVLFESHYENEDVHTEVCVYEKHEDAVKSLNEAIDDELEEMGYGNERVIRDGEDYAAVFHEYSGDWCFRVTIYERNLH